MIALEQLQKIIPYAGPRAGVYLGPINDAMDEFGINTPARIAGFLANVAHESGSLRYTREIADGRAYEGRASLGNTEPGDGPRYKGRGLIQITGRANYCAASIALFGDPDILQAAPEMLEAPTTAASSAAWFWSTHGLNDLMDAGDFQGCCAVINTGHPSTPPARINGYSERLEYYERAMEVLGNG